ncbi:MFS general substrate transporter [Dothidotthia symphoricarpi CBS 119687]|uniref:MFS general substrate transporter n=1 Tax=Dothidotthia symphoricarpi CBS 119687 TaxID=1392245 RepID=A0A6A5ZXY9_9PLEO|nr:MFS general substrate transporter [Dothidotthia symphoricarpi CBS 119687]KAF2123885.1 MFS general substrate transporter [Dothidotthia symphoricarpi CBS 119687]
MLLQRLQALPDHTAERSPYYILAVVCSAMFLDLANLSAITIALPTIQTDFGINVGDLQWIISAYALTFGGFLLLGGRGGDIFGHRRVLLFGMVFFALFSLVCAVAPTFIGLVIARAFQGIGAAFTIPSAQAHIALHFSDPTKKAKALGIWGAAGSLGFIIGLILGGVLTAFLGWRWIFWISLIISGIVIPAAYVVLPRAPSPRAVTPHPVDGGSTDDSSPAPKKGLLQSVRERLVRFDALGISLGIPGILLLTYALTSANTEGWDDAKIIATLVVSVVLLVVFILHERSAPQAILAPHLFRNLSFNLTLILAVNTYAVRQACTYFLTVQLQSYGASAIHTSVLFIPLGVSALIFNTLSGRLVPILGARAMFIIGWALSIPGILLFSFITEHTSYWRYTFPGMILYIAGIGAVYITANFVVVSSASKSDQGAAAGVFNVALQVGGSVLGLAVLTAVAEGIEKTHGDAGLPQGELSDIGYRSVYYSCVILSGIGLFLSVFAIKVPDSMRGSVWKGKIDVSAVTETSSSHELQPTQSRQS